MRRGAWVWWALPAAVTAVVAATMYHLAEQAERGSRAGAEPEMAGILVAFPFVVLFLLEVICALWAMSAESRSARTRCLGVASAGAGLVAALLVPLAPAWVLHVREVTPRSAPRSHA